MWISAERRGERGTLVVIAADVLVNGVADDLGHGDASCPGYSVDSITLLVGEVHLRPDG